MSIRRQKTLHEMLPWPREMVNCCFFCIEISSYPFDLLLIYIALRASMKNYICIKNLFIFTLLAPVISGCSLEPVQQENINIKGAPEWVNKGSTTASIKEGRMFYGVSYAKPQGDLALQKSIADDQSKAEIIRVLNNYLDVVSSEFMLSSRTDSVSVNEDIIDRRLEQAAVRQVKEVVTLQIEDAVSRQFKDKESISAQFKEEIARKIKDFSARQIRDAISYQTDFVRQLEEVITRQIKEAVSNQIKHTSQAHLVNSRVIGNWRDPRTNNIWTISELDLRNVKATMSGINDMNADMKRFFEQNADGIFERIIRDRENINPFSIR